MLSINFKGGLHRMKLTKAQKETIKDIITGIMAGALFISVYVIACLV
jgi:hypothetical protein